MPMPSLAMITRLPALLCVLGGFTIATSAELPHFSGIYPHLCAFNDEGECGTGAVVPWAGKLWRITYAPHKPKGSSDKLSEITPDLQMTIRPESVGGTPANRMIHRESQQLLIGPYVIDAQGAVRVITPQQMFGRHTGNARHLTDPANKVYYATMEEGLYEVDVKTLAVTKLWADEQDKDGRHSDLPGYHGKGLYSGQGRIIYANNGDHAKEALKDPRVPSGVLAEWDGKADAWTIVRRNQFTEVTGPGGIYGNANPETDPIWSIGWDHRSLILMLLDGGKWQAFRLPKASHSYDGAHGWNTEWPRIRDVGTDEKPDLLMTMHGMFWKFPQTFSAKNTAGIRPRSAYLKVIGDFCRWSDRLVFGCDDTAKSEFLNKRKVKGGIEGPGQSQSNLWFTDFTTPDNLGPTDGSGAVWVKDKVNKGDVSDPMLYAEWQHRAVYLVNGGDAMTSFALETNTGGDGVWKIVGHVSVAAGQTEWIEFGSAEKGEWIRVRAEADCGVATAHFTFRNDDKRGTTPDPMFAGLSSITDASQIGGVVRARGDNKRTLALAAYDVSGATAAGIDYYEMNADMKLARVDDLKAHDYVKVKAAIPKQVIDIDEASVLVSDDRGRRWRLPKADAAFDVPTNAGLLRISREVATERDLFQCHGTFYELPAENADGFAKMRPVSSHDLRIMDYASYRGLLILTGLKPDAAGDHIIRSDDGKAALWAGAIDDLWRLGKPRGHGGPWLKSKVKANEPSDAYLFAGYDKKHLTLSHDGAEVVNMKVELDITGEGFWVLYRSFEVESGKNVEHTFPAAFQARWLRVVADKDCTATAHCRYE
jgi:hypothetical protein